MNHFKLLLYVLTMIIHLLHSFNLHSELYLPITMQTSNYNNSPNPQQSSNSADR